jgi:hypothetical protein
MRLVIVGGGPAGFSAAPCRVGDRTLPDGGRVTELVARPDLNLHVPRPAGFRRIHGDATLAAAVPGPPLVPDGTGFEVRGVVTDDRPPAGSRCQRPNVSGVGAGTDVDSGGGARVGARAVHGVGRE